MNSKEDLKAIAFAEFLSEECFFNIEGYVLRDGVGKYDSTEYQIPELYDYWVENIYKP